jgi:hypothetical protein
LLLLLAGWMLTVSRPGAVIAQSAMGGLAGFGPTDYKATTDYGEGVYYAPYEITVREAPRDDAPILDQLTWRRGNTTDAVFSTAKQLPISARNLFIAYYPSMDVALMAVVGEGGNGWAEVIYDQARHLTGWVRLAPSGGQSPAPDTSATSARVNASAPLPKHFGHFQTWQELMRLNARANGIYWLNGVSGYNRSVRTAPEDTAKFVPITVIKRMKVLHIRGNWMLVEVVDFNRETPMGWLRWRDDNGKLLAFPNFSGKTLLPAMPGG